ncbi:MAG TPA: hypothetical protein PK228_06075 [Saprospiraceae bacterium]|nr:hypothetical protein [Saprospiraceae bacterium]
MRFLLPVFICWFAATLQAQTITSVSTRWSDSFVEWEIYAIMPQDTSETDAGGEDSASTTEELYGEFKLRWLNVRDDFSEWDYELGGQRGTIRQKWKDDLSQWELRSYDGNIVTMRTMWSNDLTEWRITDNSITLNLKSKWKNQFDEWLVDDATRGVFYLYTYTERDPRDWVIEDALTGEVSQSVKMAMIFITVFCGSPKM